MSETMDDKTRIAREIVALELRIDRAACAPPYPASTYLAHARKEWSHGLPETYAVADRDIAAAHAVLDRAGAAPSRPSSEETDTGATE